MPNILITSFGATWPIVPELIGFTNPSVYDLYRNHPDVDKIRKQREDYGIKPVDEVWLAATNGKQVKQELSQLQKWHRKIKGLPHIEIFSYKNLIELDTIDEIAPMSDLIYRMVLLAKEKTEDGKLYLSLAGGRKNMSADMQEAANIFGCDALIHIMSKAYKDIPEIFKSDKNFEGFFNIPGIDVACFYPFVLSGKKEESPFLYLEPQISADKYPLQETQQGKPSTDLFDEITKRQKESANTLFNLYRAVNREDPQNSYLGFQLLHPRIRQQLKDECIGVNPENRERDMQWLKQIPKAELHCHFGGILLPNEMIEVALENRKEINEALNNNPDFKDWYAETKKSVDTGDIHKLPPFNPKKNIRQRWKDKNIEEPIAIAAFLTLFEEKDELLKKYIYGKHTGNFKAIGIEEYEKLGDLQGSSLMQNEKNIRKACQILKRQCQENNIKYLELRCSPVNYTRAGLPAQKVVEILIDELEAESTVFKLIFIASRHGDTETIKEHIDLALNMRKTNSAFKKMFVGFDLAGAESVKSPGEMRKMFMNILEESIPTTIHAGEDMDVKNIWEAIYHLSAERIGHGLTLNDNADLKQRIKERKIAIELCPSSNDQIIGYKNFCNPENNTNYSVYPLGEYLKNGLKITVNTDDPGMSLTNLTNEYYKAACMVEGGLSKWEILQINRNGFKYGFLTLEEKKKLLLNAEFEIFGFLNIEYD